MKKIKVILLFIWSRAKWIFGGLFAILGLKLLLVWFLSNKEVKVRIINLRKIFWKKRKGDFDRGIMPDPLTDEEIDEELKKFRK